MKMTDGAKIGADLKRQREQRGMTRAEVADRAQITEQALAALEEGENGDPMLGLIRSVCAALDYSIDDMVRAWLTPAPSDEHERLRLAERAAAHALDATEAGQAYAAAIEALKLAEQKLKRTTEYHDWWTTQQALENHVWNQPIPFA